MALDALELGDEVPAVVHEGFAAAAALTPPVVVTHAANLGFFSCVIRLLNQTFALLLEPHLLVELGAESVALLLPDARLRGGARVPGELHRVHPRHGEGHRTGRLSPGVTTILVEVVGVLREVAGEGAGRGRERTAGVRLRGGVNGVVGREGLDPAGESLVFLGVEVIHLLGERGHLGHAAGGDGVSADVIVPRRVRADAAVVG
jgi:hypothetical protein